MAGTTRKRQRDPSPDLVDVEAPRAIGIADYVEKRAQEMEALSVAVKTCDATRTALQMLPKPLRRRAASHNIKRLPRRIREIAKKMSEKNPPVKTKRPSRKYRRRPRNLLEEYSRRSRKHSWLETHVWHAKRFKMVEQWGYKIPLHPCDKGVRSAYRSTAKYCLIQDISYFICLELQGPEDTLLQGMKQLTSADCGFQGEPYVDGSKEGHTMLYRKAEYPFGALSHVSFLWKPVIKDVNYENINIQDRTLWVWIHPGCVSCVVNEIRNVFDMQEVSSVDNTTNDQNINPSSPKKIKLNELNIRCNGVKNNKLKQDSLIYTNGKVTLVCLKDNLCRFKLTGPLSLAILCDTLIGADVKTVSKEQSIDKRWWQDVYGDTKIANIHERQKLVWKKIHSHPPYDDYVFGLTVRDPRLFVPQKKMKVPQTEVMPEENMDIIPEGDLQDSLCYSPVWEEKVRLEVKATKIPQAKLNELKNKKLVPGTELTLGNEESRIPVILIRNPERMQETSKKMGDKVKHGLSYDVILPAGWGMAFWISMIYRGARVGGLKEMESYEREKKKLHFPEDYPDTPAAMETRLAVKKHLFEKYNRKPNAKRPNYVKLGIPDPFCCPWKRLFENSTKNDLNFYVMREKSVLNKIALLLGQSSEHNSIHNLNKENVDKLKSDHKQALVPVNVDMLHRGKPDMFASISIPLSEDLQMLEQDTSFGGPLEQRHKDPRPKKLKVRKNRRKRPKKKSSENKKSNENEEAELRTKCNFMMEENLNITNHCSREVFGFVNSGGFSFSSAHGGGIGFVKMAKFIDCITKTPKKQCLVLIRNITSFQYRFATVSVINNE